MTRFFWLQPQEPRAWGGSFDAAHKWGLPGVDCPLCKAIWSDGSDAYPAVDLSDLPERRKFEKARLEEDFEEYERLCAMVQPLMPPGTRPYPGTTFGPLVGSARGRFGPLTMQYGWMLLVRRETLERLQEAGVRGLLGCRTELRFKKDPPELLEFQLEPRGLLHPDCIPPSFRVPCAKCGRLGFARPKEPLLDAASLPTDVDLFRLANFSTMIIGSERFVDAVKRLELDGVAFHELPLR